MAFVRYPKLIQTYLIFYSPSMTFHEIRPTAFDSIEHTTRTNIEWTKNALKKPKKHPGSKNSVAFLLIDFVWRYRKEDKYLNEDVNQS